MKNYPKIRPVTDLRDTNEISRQCHETNEPVFITKNGYSDLVIMSDECFRSFSYRREDYALERKNALFCPRPVNEKNNGFVRIATHSLPVTIGDIQANLKAIEACLDRDISRSIDLAVFPELSLTGYSCADLFFNRTSLNSVEAALVEVARYAAKSSILYVIGAPFNFQNKLYNCAFVFSKGRLLGIVPKSYLPNSDEFYEKRYFQEAPKDNFVTVFDGYEVPFGAHLLFHDRERPSLTIGVEISNDLWAPISLSAHHVLNGASVILNPAAFSESLDTDPSEMIRTFSERGLCAYACASPTEESTAELVYSGRAFIVEVGEVLGERNPFGISDLMADIDLERITFRRLKNSLFTSRLDQRYQFIEFASENRKKSICRHYSALPFISQKDSDNLFAIRLQSEALAHRLRHIGSTNVVIGLSGGLDSTLAVIVAHETMKLLNYPSSHIFGYYLSAMGSGLRTKKNAVDLARKLGITFEEIDLTASIKSHFRDLRHDGVTPDLTFENAQARERTQFLFDKANSLNAIVVGTGDLSELALGFCTYNGDHMSNYAVNASLPKTLIRAVVKAYAAQHRGLETILSDILSTPVSPELLPPDDVNPSQLTEEIIGPYELHDFFLYHLILDGFSFYKLGLTAIHTFKNRFVPATVIKWLKVFARRFYSQQFKRSASPEGAKISPVSLSPRGDWRMPSDASIEDALKDILRLEEEL